MKYCRTASRDSVEARTRALKIWKSDAYRARSQRLMKSMCERRYLQTLQRSSQTRKRRLDVLSGPLVRIGEVCLRYTRLHSLSGRARADARNYHTHSLVNTPSLQRGPRSDLVSKVAAVALGGSQSSILVIIMAIGFTDTSASSPPTTPRQPASPPPRPSGRKSEGWKSN